MRRYKMGICISVLVFKIIISNLPPLLLVLIFPLPFLPIASWHFQLICIVSQSHFYVGHPTFILDSTDF